MSPYARKASKYSAKRTQVDGVVFASKKEARRYQELTLLMRAGEITHLVLQPRFDLWAAAPLKDGWREAVRVAAYVADFQYRDQRNGGVTVIEDVKGMKTRVYGLKKKLFEACYGLVITEV